MLISSITAVFIVYQLTALFLPYLSSKITGSSYRFPDYFYRVYGDDVTDLQSEHYGYLISAALMCFFSFRFVAPSHPFSKIEVSKFSSDIGVLVSDMKSKFERVRVILTNLVDKPEKKNL